MSDFGQGIWSGPIKFPMTASRHKNFPPAGSQAGPTPLFRRSVTSRQGQGRTQKAGTTKADHSGKRLGARGEGCEQSEGRSRGVSVVINLSFGLGHHGFLARANIDNLRGPPGRPTLKCQIPCGQCPRYDGDLHQDFLKRKNLRPSYL